MAPPCKPLYEKRMQLFHDQHLAYCTNIHRGEDWAETFAGLKANTLRVKAAVCPESPYAIGLRLSARAAVELSEKKTLSAFRHWLDQHGCYVFTINGFPYGSFHGTKVKEQVYRPDWTTPERLDYTKRLFDLLSRIVPEGVGGSISTCPASFKPFGIDAEGDARIREHLFLAAEHIQRLSERSGKDLHLGLEPEPLCYVETSGETVDLVGRVLEDHSGQEDWLRRRLGVNYDCCHLAVQYEEAAEALGRFHDHGVRISKIHLSSALELSPTPKALARLRAFEEDIYLHQVIIRRADGSLQRIVDLGEALDGVEAGMVDVGDEWRVHFHIPIHHEPADGLHSTADHLVETLDWIAAHPAACSHFEMETYTWEVLPPEIRQSDVVDSIVNEYAWCLEKLRARHLAP